MSVPLFHKFRTYKHIYLHMCTYICIWRWCRSRFSTNFAHTNIYIYTCIHIFVSVGGVGPTFAQTLSPRAKISSDSSRGEHTYTHTHTHTHAHTHAYTHTHTHTHTQTNTDTQINTHTQTHAHTISLSNTHTHIFTPKYSFMYINVYSICIHKYMHTHKYVHIYIHTFGYTYIHTFTCIYT